MLRTVLNQVLFVTVESHFERNTSALVFVVGTPELTTLTSPSSTALWEPELAATIPQGLFLSRS
jgi:hypothetical protein